MGDEGPFLLRRSAADRVPTGLPGSCGKVATTAADSPVESGDRAR